MVSPFTQTPFTETMGWRDPAVLTEGLAVGPDDTVISLDPSGEDACTLAIAGAGRVIAVLPRFGDFALFSLRLAAVRSLPIQSVRALFGFGDFGRRLWFYHYVREQVPHDVRRFWDIHEEEIRLGLVHRGRLEGVLRAFRTRILPLLVPRGAENAWFELETTDAQRRVWARDWNRRPWRAALAAAEATARAHRMPIPPAADGKRLTPWRDRVARMFTEFPAREHFILQQALLGQPADLEHAAPAWSHTGHQALRGALERIELRNMPILDALTSHPFTHMDLHTALDAPESRLPGGLLDVARRALPPSGRLLGWATYAALPPATARLSTTEADLLRRDRSLLSGELGLWRG